MSQCGRPTANGTPCKISAQGAFGITIACLLHFTKADEELRDKLWTAYGEGRITGEKAADRRFQKERAAIYEEIRDELRETYRKLQMDASQ